VLDLVERIEPTLWRAATDNDGFKLMSQHHGGGQALARWLDHRLDRGLPDAAGHRQTVTELADGSLLSSHTFDLADTLADPARIGVRFGVPPEFTHVRWFGLGPHENYPDRRSSALTGIWGGLPDELPYLVPQDFGLRSDCRWFELVAPAEGIALRITPRTPRLVNCSATWHTDEDLFAAADPTELVRREFLTVHVDAATRGLGTGSCGPDVLPQYRIAAGRHRLEYWLSVRVLSR
jgi:beta-galactosidase